MLKDHLIGHKHVIFQDQWSLETRSATDFQPLNLGPFLPGNAWSLFLFPRAVVTGVSNSVSLFHKINLVLKNALPQKKQLSEVQLVSRKV